jgi:hypothetical protein
MRATIIAASAGTASLIAGIVTPMVIPATLPVWIRWSLLGLAGALYLLAIGVWLWGRLKGDGSALSGTNATTAGDHSPAFVGTFGDVHYHATPAPAATQPVKSPYGSGNPTSPPAPSLADAYMQGRFTADMPLGAVLSRVYYMLGGAPKEAHLKRAFYDKVDRELIKGVRQHDLFVWAFYGKRGPDLLSKDMIRRGYFEHKSMAFILPSDSLHPMRFEHLEFNREQVDRVWSAPPKSPPGSIGGPPKSPTLRSSLQALIDLGNKGGHGE